MKQLTRTYVTFEATGFNTTEDKEEFINPGNFGKDVAEWLISELKGKVPNIDPEIGQEDSGWYFTFTGNSGKTYDFLVGRRGDEDWLGCFECSLGFFKSILGLRKISKVDREDLVVFHKILKCSNHISNIKWHYEKDFMKGNEDAYSDTP